MSKKKRKIRSAFPGYILTPKGDFYQAKKIGITAERIKKDPVYDLTRKNNREFGKVARFSKAIREAFGKHLPETGTAPALMKILRKVLDTDTENMHGNRSFRNADFTALAGFEFDPWLSFHNMVRIDIQIGHQPHKKQLQITIPAFDPAEAIHEENQLAHYQIAFILVGIDLIDNTWCTEEVTTGMILRKQTMIKRQQLELDLHSESDTLYLLAGTLEYYAPLPDSRALVKKKCDQPLTIINMLHALT
jgi:hypothetical protein